MRKPELCICGNKGADDRAADQISAFVFATWLYNIQVSSHRLWLHSLDCVHTGLKL